MPAIEISRLKLQIEELSWKLSRPEEFRRSLISLFERYGNPAYRAGQMVQTSRRSPSYRVPALLLQQLNLELAKWARKDPEAAMAAADELWKDAYLESRLSAAQLLGQTPVEAPEPVVERLNRWCRPAEERQMLQAALSAGSTRLRAEAPQAWLQLLQGWLNRAQPAYNGMVLQAILNTVNDRQFENIPPLYEMLSPLLQSPTPAYTLDLANVIEALVRRSPRETAYFLRQILGLNPGITTIRFIRSTIPFFPKHLQEELKAAAKSG